MAETVALTSPVVTTRNVVRITRFIGDVEAKSFTLEWATNINETGSAYFPTPAILNPLGVMQPTGASILSTLNTANLTANSLVKRFYPLLQSNGYIGAGAVSGVAD